MNSIQKIYKSIYTWFLKPYPYVFSILNNLKISFGFGLVIFLFLYIFKPFGIINVPNDLLHYTLGYGLITLFVLLFSFFLLPLLFPKFFNPNQWILGKFILFIFFILVTISVLNKYYTMKVLIHSETTNDSFMNFIFFTFSIGIFPIIIFVYFIEKTSFKKNELIANTIVDNKIINKDLLTVNKKISIIADNKKDEFTISIVDLIYISSQGNYASIFCLSDGEIQEHLIRTSLSKIENQLKESKHIIRCHKSYLVNTNQVSKINGNARGYLLKINHIDFSIPVSRNFPKELLYTLIQ